MKRYVPNGQASEIRVATPDDAEAIRRVQAETWIATYPNRSLGISDLTLEQYMLGPQGNKQSVRRDRIRAQIENTDDTHITFVAVAEDEVVGYSAPFIQRDGRQRVGALYVLPAFQGLGIGSGLLSHVLDWYDFGSDVFLNVAEYNTSAIQFYKHRGFGYSNRPGSDSTVEIAHNTWIPEREMVRYGVKTNPKK